MDSLALSVSCGLQPVENRKTMAAKVSLIFATVESSMILLGFFLGSFFAEKIAFIDHWIAFGLLGLIGGHMLREGLTTKETSNYEAKKTKKLTLFVIFIMGFASSIDALAAGFSLLATNLPIPWTILTIFGANFLVSLFGYSFGAKLGTVFKSRAEIFGGLVLIGLGTKILLEHLFFA